MPVSKIALLVICAFVACLVAFLVDKRRHRRQFLAGNLPADLKVYVTGAACSAVEVYFRNEYYHEEFAESIALNDVENVVLAPKNPWGTFAIKTGKAGQTVKVYGWRGGESHPTCWTDTFDPEIELCLQWMTDRICRIYSNREKRNLAIVRFNDADIAFTRLDASPDAHAAAGE